MSFLFGGTKTPSISVPQAPAITSTTDQATLKEAEKKKLRTGQAVRPTLLTGPQGLLEAAPVGRKTLLGE